MSNHPIEDWVLYSKGDTPMPPIFTVKKLAMPNPVCVCPNCGTLVSEDNDD